MGGLLAGVENRLKAYVLQVRDGGLVTHLTGPEDRVAWLARPEVERQQWVEWMHFSGVQITLISPLE